MDSTSEKAFWDSHGRHLQVGVRGGKALQSVIGTKVATYQVIFKGSVSGREWCRGLCIMVV